MLYKVLANTISQTQGASGKEGREKYWQILCYCILNRVLSFHGNMDQIALVSLAQLTMLMHAPKQLHRLAEGTIEGFMRRHIRPILQVIVLMTTMLVSSLHSLVLENTTKHPRTFHLSYIIIPNYNWVTRILARTLGWIWNSVMKWIQNNSVFCCFSPYRTVQNGNHRAGQNYACTSTYRVM